MLKDGYSTIYLREFSYQSLRMETLDMLLDGLGMPISKIPSIVNHDT